MTVVQRVHDVRRRVEEAALAANRRPDEITLSAVSKTFGPGTVIEALDAGITDLGENRAQELRAKASMVGDRARWHFIGPLQTNKVRQVVGVAAVIHSVDRLPLAEEIARRARARGLVQDVLVEVNVAGDPAKHGAEPSAAIELTERVSGLEGLRLRGLMTMPPYPREAEDSRTFYKELAALGDLVVERIPGATDLSMGMTRDFGVAIAEGATIVRVGEAIFGPRD